MVNTRSSHHWDSSKVENVRGFRVKNGHYYDSHLDTLTKHYLASELEIQVLEAKKRTKLDDYNLKRKRVVFRKLRAAIIKRLDWHRSQVELARSYGFDVEDCPARTPEAAYA